MRKKVSYLGDSDNISTINEYSGGIFEAIKLCEDSYGEFEISKCNFYALLAFVSVYEKLFDIIEDKVNGNDNNDDDESDITN